MAKKETNPLIHCEACGEDYSATYRRCPFCGNKTATRTQDAARDDGYAPEGGRAFDEEMPAGARSGGREQRGEVDRMSAGRGGKRLAGTGTAAGASRSQGNSSAGRNPASGRGYSSAGVSRSGSSRGNGPVPQGRSAVPRSRAPQPKRSAFMEFWDRVGISPVRVIGFVFTLIVIIVVFLLVTKLILPAIGRGSVDTPNNEKPSQSQSAEPSPSAKPSTKPVEKDPEPTNTIPADQTAVDFTLNHKEFTISAQWPNPVRLEVTLLPAGSKGTVTFSSSNPEAVDVTADGVVWATGKGSATITATLPGAEPQTVKVISSVAGGVPPADPTPAPSTSPNPQPSSSAQPNGKLKLSITEFTMSDQYPHPVTIKVTAGATGKVTWTSSNSAVASVDQNGKVSMVGDGRCTITATDSAGNASTCLVRCN